MKLGWVIHYVEDVPKTVAFYQHAFGLGVKMQTPGGEFAALETGETALAFCSQAFLRADSGFDFVLDGPHGKTISQEIGLVTENVPTAYAAALAAGAVAVSAPKTKEWGQVVAYLRDCNGFLVEICTPL